MLHKKLRGRDLHAPTNELVENNTGSTISKLKVVAIDGMGTSYPQVRPANANVDVNFGITYDDIPTGKCGYVTCYGFMFEVDTSPWAPFTILYGDINGNLSTSPVNGIVAQVIKQDASDGILYVVTEPNTAAASRSWRLIGNAGTDPHANFIGTIDAVDFSIRTEAIEAIRIDAQQRVGIGSDIDTVLNHVHQKTHSGFDGSGLRTETYSLVTTFAGDMPAFTIPISNQTVVKVEITALARISDGSGRAAFKRSGLFYRENSNVQAQRVWQSDFTEKSDPNFGISYTLGVGQLTINVKSAVNINTYWTGHVKIEAVSTDV